MALGTWWVGDPLPHLPSLPTFSCCLETQSPVIAELTHLSAQEIKTRWREGHHIYRAFLQETCVAYGWVATRQGGVEELRLSFSLPPRNFYLWDFQTFPQWRGRGIYPHFLQAILSAEQALAERFWILYDPANAAAARALRKAGFVFLGELTLTEQGFVSGIELFDENERGPVGAALLNLPIVADKDSPP